MIIQYIITYIKYDIIESFSIIRAAVSFRISFGSQMHLLENTEILVKESMTMTTTNLFFFSMHSKATEKRWKKRRKKIAKENIKYIQWIVNWLREQIHDLYSVYTIHIIPLNTFM